MLKLGSYLVRASPPAVLAALKPSSAAPARLLPRNEAALRRAIFPSKASTY